MLRTVSRKIASEQGIAVLPQILNEDQIFIFKFWFNGTIQHGMYYQEELFCRLGVYDVQHRPRVYQAACKLGYQDAPIVLTCSADHCSLWGSLRSALVRDILLHETTLPLPGMDKMDAEANSDQTPG